MEFLIIFTLLYSIYDFSVVMEIFETRVNGLFLSCLVLSLALPSDVLSPTVVSVSDSSPHQIRVSWGPLQPNRVQRYVVEYGAIPSGRVQTMTLQRQQNSTLLTGLEPGTQYLVTVSAVHADGKERAMSVRACTQEGTSSV